MQVSFQNTERQYVTKGRKFKLILNPKLKESTVISSMCQIMEAYFFLAIEVLPCLA